RRLELLPIRIAVRSLARQAESLSVRDVAPDLSRADDDQHAVREGDVSEVPAEFARERAPEGLAARGAVFGAEKEEAAACWPGDPVVGHDPATVAEPPPAVVLDPPLRVAVRTRRHAQPADAADGSGDRDDEPACRHADDLGPLGRSGLPQELSGLRVE